MPSRATSAARARRAPSSPPPNRVTARTMSWFSSAHVGVAPCSRRAASSSLPTAARLPGPSRASRTRRRTPAASRPTGCNGRRVPVQGSPRQPAGGAADTSRPRRASGGRPHGLPPGPRPAGWTAARPPPRPGRRVGQRRVLGKACATSMRKPSTPRSNQNRRMSSNSARTSVLSQLRSGCLGSNRCRYHSGPPSASVTRVQARPPKTLRQSLGGSRPSGPLPSQDVAVACRGSGRCGQRLGEPRVFVRGVVGDDVEDDAKTQLVGLDEHLLGFGESAEGRVDAAVVGDVVAAVGHGRGVTGVDPQRVDTQVRAGTAAGRAARRGRRRRRRFRRRSCGCRPGR